MKRPVPITAAVIVFAIFALILVFPIINAIPRFTSTSQTPMIAKIFLMILLLIFPTIFIVEVILLSKKNKWALIISKILLSAIILLYLTGAVLSFIKNSKITFLIPMILPAGFLAWLLKELFNNNVKEYFKSDY